MDCLAWLRNIIIVDVWEIRKHKLYDSDSGSGQQLHCQSSPGESNGKFSQNGKFGQNGKLGHSCVRVMRCRPYDSRVSSYSHNCGCVVDEGGAMAYYYYYYYHYNLLQYNM